MASRADPSHRIFASQAEKCGPNIIGRNSSVSVDEGSGSIVVAYQHTHSVPVFPDVQSTPAIHYAFGDIKRDAMKITWRSEKTCESISGHNPKIALLKNDKKTVVMVYVKDNRCYCRLGLVKGNESIAWDEVEQIIDEGTNPSVTVSNDKTLIVAFISNSRAYSRVGVVNESSRKIEWKSDKREIADRVEDVDISMNKNKDVVVAYTKATSYALDNGTIHCKVGSVRSGQVEFGKESAELNGHFPSISINDHSHILVMFQQLTLKLFQQNLFIQCGVLQSGSIQWAVSAAASGGIDSGRNPSVYLMNSNRFVEVHSGFFTKFLFFRTGEMK